MDYQEHRMIEILIGNVCDSLGLFDWPAKEIACLSLPGKVGPEFYSTRLSLPLTD
jgi:hypothetical protein